MIPMFLVLEKAESEERRDVVYIINGWRLEPLEFVSVYLHGPIRKAGTQADVRLHANVHVSTSISPVQMLAKDSSPLHDWHP
jgi:hypothetical protein